MKKYVIFTLLAVMVVGTICVITACDSPARLASKIEGSWTGVPTHFNKKEVSLGTFTPTLEFSRQGTTTSGTVLLSAPCAVTMPINSPVDPMGLDLVSATATGLVTVSGIWTAHDDDEVSIAFDPASLVVTMDPEVQFEVVNVMTATDIPQSGPVSAAVMNSFRQQIKRGMNYVIAHASQLDDISFPSSSILHCEINDRHLTFSRN